MASRRQPRSSGWGSLAGLLPIVLVSCAALTGTIRAQQQLAIQNATAQQQPQPTSKPNYLETGRQITGILDRFMSLGYDKRVRPNYGGPPVEVNVTMRILSISSVSEVMMDFTADFYFRQTWHDPRLSFKKLGDIQTLYVGAEVSKKIWLPDTFFGNEKMAYFHEATTPNVFLRIDHSGEVYRSIRLTVTSSCPMNLQYFPMDRQRCTIEAESYGYNVKDIIYRWARKDTAVERDKEISLPQFDIVQTVQKYRLEELSSGTYSRLIAEIHFARRMGYYLIQIYIPSSLIVVISWVSFWLHRNASPARVQLGVTTVLTMTTLMSSTNAALPKISYVKSIDIFLGTCFVMVFAALLEYATVGYLGKRIAMRKAHAQHAQTQAQARLFAQLQAQGAQGEPVPFTGVGLDSTVEPPLSSMGPVNPASAPLGLFNSSPEFPVDSHAFPRQTSAPRDSLPLASLLSGSHFLPAPHSRQSADNGHHQHEHQHHQQACSCSHLVASHPDHLCQAQEPKQHSHGRRGCARQRHVCSHAGQQADARHCELHAQPQTPPRRKLGAKSSTSAHCHCQHRSSQTLPRILHQHQSDFHQLQAHQQSPCCSRQPHGTISGSTLSRPGAGDGLNAFNTPTVGLSPSKGASAAAAAAAATFVNLHRRNKGLPPSTNPNFAQFGGPFSSPYTRHLETIFGIRPSDIDKYSRVVFPVCFVCFQLMYWIVYLHISAFLEPDSHANGQQQPPLMPQPMS